MGIGTRRAFCTAAHLAALFCCSGSASARTEEGALLPERLPASAVYPDSRAPASASEGAPLTPLFALPAPLSLHRWQQERGLFSLHPKDPFAGGVSLEQMAQFRDGGRTFKAEMGDLSISESPGTASELSRRGARFSLATSAPSAAAEIKSFAFSGERPADDRSSLVGVAGKLSLMDILQVKTILVSAKEMLPAGMRGGDAARRGDVLGVVAAYDPFQGRLALEGELDYALFDADTTDGAPAVGDVACRTKVGGGAGGYRYSALYERTGPRYQIISGSAPERDSEGYSVQIGRELGVHALEVKLSRYHDNVRESPLFATLYRYEGIFDYSLKALEALPLHLQYTKKVAQSDGLAGGTPSGSDEDTFVGHLSYRLGEWDLGVRASYQQRTDLVREERDLASATLGLAPRFSAGGMTVAPDLSLKRSYYPLEGARSDEYRAGLDIRGNTLYRQLDYQLKGGYRKVLTEAVAVASGTVAGVRLVYPLKVLRSVVSRSSVGVRGEYNGSSDQARRESAYSLLVVLEGG